MRLLGELRQILKGLLVERDASKDGDACYENIDALACRLETTAKRLGARLKAAEAVCKQVGECDYSFMETEKRGFSKLCELTDVWRNAAGLVPKTKRRAR